ncbi:Ig-like domain-containing protein, partial [Pseudoalteromonas sp. T1lg22]|uniref:Ig-like domain-containing protein n=1 Tax=Pseudoalteromonas sp. T1lg22 TaxID=2077096 RepID=UPI001F490156
MVKGYEIIVYSGERVVESHSLTTDGGALTINAQNDVRYELLDPATGVAPQQVLFKREGENLELHFGDAAPDAIADVIITGYYDLSTPPKFFGLAEDGDYYSFVPQSGLTEDLLEKLDEDDETYQSLGYEDSDSGIMWWPLVLGGAALAALALDGGSDSDDKVSIAPDNLDIEAPIVIFNDLITNDTTPELNGTVNDPDAKVVVIINGIEYEATNNGDGTWTLADDVVAELEDGTTAVVVIATDPTGNEGEAEGEVVIDTVAPGNGDDGNSIIFDDGGDNLLSATEAADATLSGQIETGASIIRVVISDGTTDIEVDPTAISVDENGNVTISGQDLSIFADGELTVTMTVEDAAGNRGNVTDTTTLDTGAPSTGDGANSIAFDDGGDELLSAEEATNVTLSGVVEAGATVDSITISDGVTTIKVPSSAISTDSNGNLTVVGQDLSGLADGELTVTMTVTDAAGNTGTVTDTTTLDTGAPSTGDDVNSIAFDDGGDELLSASEATSVTLSGVVEAGATVDSITISDGVTTITV